MPEPRSGTNLSEREAAGLGPVVIVDDDAVVAESLAALVSTQGFATRCYASAEEFLADDGQPAPWCVITDHRLPQMSGADLADHIHLQYPACGVVLVTGYAETPLVVRALKSGAVTVLDKPFQPQAIWDALADARRHHARQPVSEHELAQFRRRLGSLTTGERAVLDRIAAGVPHKRIAAELDIGLRTVELRRSKIMGKMGASSLAELIRMVTLLGLPTTRPAPPAPEHSPRSSA